MAKPIVFEDIFEVLAIDPGGKHFDKGRCSQANDLTLQAQVGNVQLLLLIGLICDCCAVSRFQCHSDLYEMDLMLDINTSIYPLQVTNSYPVEPAQLGLTELQQLCIFRCWILCVLCILLKLKAACSGC